MLVGIDVSSVYSVEGSRDMNKKEKRQVESQLRGGENRENFYCCVTIY